MGEVGQNSEAFTFAQSGTPRRRKPSVRRRPALAGRRAVLSLVPDEGKNPHAAGKKSRQIRRKKAAALDAVKKCPAARATEVGKIRRRADAKKHLFSRYAVERIEHGKKTRTAQGEGCAPAPRKGGGNLKMRIFFRSVIAGGKGQSERVAPRDAVGMEIGDDHEKFLRGRDFIKGLDKRIKVLYNKEKL